MTDQEPTQEQGWWVTKSDMISWNLLVIVEVIKEMTNRDTAQAQTKELFIVRLYDGFDHIWMDVSKPVSKEEAQKIWNKKTKNGTEKTKYDDIDYFAIFPANTVMLRRMDGIYKPGQSGR